MNDSKIEDSAAKAASAVKAEAEELADKASEGAAEVAKEARHGADKVVDFVRSNPVSSVLAVGAIFFGFGWSMGASSGGRSGG